MSQANSSGDTLICDTVIYGIKSCSTMKKAFDKLDQLGVAYAFHDYKKQGIDRATLAVWVDQLGLDKVLNKRGTTWRKLADQDKQNADASVEAALDLMVAQPSLIKRPIIRVQQADTVQFLVGFDEAVLDQTF